MRCRPNALHDRGSLAELNIHGLTELNFPTHPFTQIILLAIMMSTLGIDKAAILLIKCESFSFADS